jgi:hypothetical protein
MIVLSEIYPLIVVIKILGTVYLIIGRTCDLNILGIYGGFDSTFSELGYDTAKIFLTTVDFRLREPPAVDL